MEKYKERQVLRLSNSTAAFLPTRLGFVVKEAHKRDIVVIADFWRMNMDRIIMEATGLDGWAHCSPSEIPASSNKWMADNDRFCIVTATLGEAMSGSASQRRRWQEVDAQGAADRGCLGRRNGQGILCVYPQIRHNYYDGPEAFYQQNGFGDLSRFRAKFLENIKNAHDAGVLLAGGSDCVYPKPLGRRGHA